MQTFLTSSNFEEAVADIDNKRIQKQLLEVRQILAALSGRSRGWRNHPATLMWEDSPRKLYEYAQALIKENQRRGYKTDLNAAAIEEIYADMDPGKPQPWWMDDPEMVAKVTRTHRASLYRKAPESFPEFAQDNEGYEAFVCCPVEHKTARGKKRGVCSYWWPTHYKEAQEATHQSS